MRTLIAIAALGGLAAFGAVWWTGSGSSEGERIALRADDRAVVAEGRVIYREACAACHGVQLEGQPNWKTRAADGTLPAPPHDPSGHTWHHPDQALFELTKYGPGPATGNPDYRSNMPAYSEILTDAEIIAVLSYIKSRWPAEIQARHDEINTRSAVN